MTLVKACLNGARPRDEHPAVPVTPEEIAADGARAVEAGAGALHVHPRGPDGRDSLAPDDADAVVRALRASCPGVPIGLTTGIWAAEDAEHRFALVAGWDHPPDFVSVNLREPGVEGLCALLLERGIGIEAGLWDLDDVDRLADVAHRERFLRVLVEALPEEAGAAVAGAAAMAARLAELGIDLPQVHHGFGLATWPVMEAGIAAGHDVRVGLEDTLVLADGTPARDNAELVAAAVAMVGVR